MLMKNSNDTIGNRTRDLPACSAVTKPTAPPRAPPPLIQKNKVKFKKYITASCPLFLVYVDMRNCKILRCLNTSFFPFVPCILILSKFLHQLMQKFFKSSIKIYIKTAPNMFRCNHHHQAAHYLRLLKLHLLKQSIKETVVINLVVWLHMLSGPC